MDRDDLELFQRSLRDATNDYSGSALDGALEEFGWRDAMAIEPRAAISTLFQLQGESNATSSALGHVLRRGLGLNDMPAIEIVLPPIGRWDPPGKMSGRSLHVDGLASAVPSDTASVVVISETTHGDIALTAPAASLAFDRVGGMDPNFGLLRVTGRDVQTYTELTPPGADWTSAVALARLALGHELVGASRKMLELAREHALGRIQFGRPIGSFQAIRHRLAETLVAVEMADALLDSAWLDGTPVTAAMAKAMAGRQARIAARHCQQVLAGIGFTTEHPLHLYIRRTLVLDGLLGSSTALTRVLGEEVMGVSKLPPLLPL
jgi:hypothetical protein